MYDFIITFSMKNLRKIHAQLVEAQRNGERFRPTFDQAYNPEIYHKGMYVDTKGRTASECEKLGEFFSPNLKNIDDSKIAPAFHFVGDHGIYLMGNHPKPKHQERNTVAYADGGDPDKDDEWYDYKRALLGGDDFVLEIPENWVRYAIAKNKRKFKMGFTETSIKYVD